MHPEYRTVSRPIAIETRTGEGGEKSATLFGHAAVFDTWTTLYEGRYWTWREVIRPKAFRRAIKEKQDVRALLNHDPNYVLGRTLAGTLTLREDDVGLYVEITPPSTQTIQDLVVGPIQRKDIDQMSFAFRPRQPPEESLEVKKDGTTIIRRAGERVTIRQEGDMTIEEREIIDADLFDVSPVTYPQYDGTDIGARSSEWSVRLRERIAEEDRPRQRTAPKREHFMRMLSGDLS